VQPGDGVEQSLKKSRKDLLAFFSDLKAFLSMQLVDILFGGNKEEGVEPLPTIMTITQGDCNYANKLSSRITNQVPHATQAARSLMDMLAGLHLAAVAPLAGEEGGGESEGEGEGEGAEAEGEEAEEGAVQDATSKLERVRKALRARLLMQSNAVVDRARDCEERLCQHSLQGKKCRCDWDAAAFDGAGGDVEKFLAHHADVLYPAAEDAVLACLVRACKAVDGCAGLKKLEECVAGLELSQRFDCNVRPPQLGRDDAILAYLGCSAAAFGDSVTLLAGWRAYVRDWKKPAVALSPTAVCAFWRAHVDGRHASLIALGKLALKEFSRPISSACCERIFSYLTHMDANDRQTMGKDLLAMLLFLRGNWRLVHTMVVEEHAADMALRLKESQRSKRRRAAVDERQGEEAQAAAAAAAAAEEAQDAGMR